MESQDRPRELSWCPGCEHEVQAVTSGTPSLVGIVVTLQRCPGCETVVIPQSAPKR